MRIVAAFVAGGLVAAVSPAAVAQPGVYAAAEPPTAAQLRPLNLATVWTTAVPVDGRKDGVGLVQVVDDKQIFVQTRGGVLVALDAATGSQQWVARYDAQYAPLLPVVVNDRFVFAVNVIKLYCIHRYTGVVEFASNLPLAPQAAPAVDDTHVYVTIGSGRMAALELPAGVRMPDQALTRRTAFGLMTNDARSANPADVVAGRYPGTGRRTYFPEDRFEESKVRLSVGEPGAGLGTMQRAPSLSVVRTLSPPYRLFDDGGRYIKQAESLATVGSLRQPYQLQSPTAGMIQRTPSITTIPPSVASAFALSNLLPKGIEPKQSWVYGSTVRLVHPPLVTRQRVWMLTASPRMLAVLKADKTPQIDAETPDAAAAPAGQAEDIGYVPLQDGNLLAVRLDAGNAQTMRLVWRSNVGGLMDKAPVPTTDAVFAGGQHSGVARLDRRTGELTWRTPSESDTLLAVSKEHVYVWDRGGRVQVYDRARVSDPATKLALPLVSVPFPGYSVPVTNGKTDRILLASDNGLLVCLRDASPGYARPLLVGPPVHSAEELPKKPLDPAAPTDPVPPVPEKKVPPTPEEKKVPPATEEKKVPGKKY